MYFKTKSVYTTFDCKVSSYFCNENSSLGNFQSVNESVLKQTVSCLFYLPKHEQVIQIQQRITNKIAMLQIYCMVNLRDINIISRSFFFNSQISKAKSFSVLRKDKTICSRFFAFFYRQIRLFSIIIIILLSEIFVCHLAKETAMKISKIVDLMTHALTSVQH